MIAAGLRTPTYAEPAPEHGESTFYTVVAVSADERVSPVSSAVVATSPKPKKMEK